MIALLTMKGWFFVAALAFTLLAIYQAITYYKLKKKFKRQEKAIQEVREMCETLKSDHASIYTILKKLVGDLPH